MTNAAGRLADFADGRKGRDYFSKRPATVRPEDDVSEVINIKERAIQMPYPAGRRTAQNYTLKTKPDARGADNAHRSLENGSEKFMLKLNAATQVKWTAPRQLHSDKKLATEAFDAGNKLERSTGSWGGPRQREQPT